MNATVSARADYLRPEQVADVVRMVARELDAPVVLLIRWDGHVSVRPLAKTDDRSLRSHAFTGTWRHPLDVEVLVESIVERIEAIAAGWIG